MTDAAWLDALVARYRTRGVLIDANLLLVWLVGQTDRRLLGPQSAYKRTRVFGTGDFELLDRFLHRFDRRVVSPGVLTEASNLGDFSGRHRESFHTIFASALTVLDERHVPARDLVDAPALRRLGLSDAVLAALANQQLLLLTDDLKLAAHVAAQGCEVVNFNHLRPLAW